MGKYCWQRARTPHELHTSLLEISNRCPAPSLTITVGSNKFFSTDTLCSFRIADLIIPSTHLALIIAHIRLNVSSSTLCSENTYTYIHAVYIEYCKCVDLCMEGRVCGLSTLLGWVPFFLFLLFYLLVCYTHVFA